MRAQLRPCTQRACKRRYTYTKIKSASLLRRPLWFKKIKITTTTTLLISQQSRIITAIVHCSILNLLHPYLEFQVSLVDLSQSDIQILDGLQINNGILECVSSSFTAIFKNNFVVHGQYIRFATPPLISIFQEWQSCYVNRSRSVQEWRVVVM